MSNAPQQIEPRATGAQLQFPLSLTFDPNFQATSSAGAAATVAASADASRPNCVRQIFGSYSATPTGGRLTVQDGSTTVFDLDIIAGGPLPVITFDPPLVGTKNNALTITLAGGGGSVVAKLYASVYKVT